MAQLGAGLKGKVDLSIKFKGTTAGSRTRRLQPILVSPAPPGKPLVKGHLPNVGWD
jgi:hypothetical protein